jgi:hypothetical protein
MPHTRPASTVHEKQLEEICEPEYEESLCPPQSEKTRLTKRPFRQ